MSDVERLFRAESPGDSADEKWPFNVMEDALHVAASAYSDYPKRPNPRWTVTLYYAVNTYRNEVAKMRAAHSWRAAERLRQQALAANRQAPDADDDED